jgi:hypothetical protein
MSKTWKWILGITLGLVILFGVGFAAATFFGGSHMSFVRSENYGHPMMDDYGFNGRGPMGGGYNDHHPMMDDYGFRGRNPMEGYNNYRHPMMGGYGFMPLPFLFLGGLLRLIFPLAILGAVGYFSYKKGKKDGMAAAVVDPAPVLVEQPKPKAKKVAEE